MSNSIDVLCVGGPKDGVVICMPRPAARFIDCPSIDGGVPVGVYTYERIQHARDGFYYHIAIPATEGAEDPTDEDINAAIDAFGFTPGWDINPMPGSRSGR